MLIDSMLSVDELKDFSLSILCIACIVFVIKLERDVNNDLRDFFQFAKNKLKLKPKELFQCESLIILHLPGYFAKLVDFSELLHSYSQVLSIYHDSDKEIENIWAKITEKYIKGSENMSIKDLVIDPFIASSYPESQISSKTKKLLSIIKHFHRKERKMKSRSHIINKTVKLVATV
jgi:hypothetical protein